ncbi:outer membrane protein assembly factor BamA [candidate division KSB1 bacterium]|nr:outer membrane protein assembly factor BamA [candidate division KSB1 bacterium]
MKYLLLIVCVLNLALYVHAVNGFPQKQKASQKYTVQKIHIEGNESLSEHTIKRVMLTKERGWFSHPAFYNNLFDDDLQTIIQLYQNKGYLDVSLESNVKIVEEKKHRVELWISIQEGPITFIDRVEFNGNSVFTNAQLAKMVSYKVGEPFNGSMLEKNNYTIIASYAQKGYIDALVTPELNNNKEQHLMSVIITIQEGVQAYIRGIHIYGLNKIQPKVVERELLLKPNMVFDYSKLLESQHQLYQTGLFNQVSIRPVKVDSTNPKLRNLIVNVSENKNGEFGIGLGFGSYERLRGSLEVTQNSFLGKSLQIGARIRVSKKDQKLEILYTNPWLFNTRTKFDLSAFAEHQIEPNYELQGGGGRSTAGKQLSQYDKLTISYKYQDLLFSNVKDTTEIRDRIRGNTRSLQLNYVRDTRDNQFNSTTGAFFDVRWESAGGFLRGTNTFTKVTGEGRHYIKLNFFPTGIAGARYYLGWAETFGSSKTLPLNERFYAGGDGTIRGYGRREVGPKAYPDVPIGGKLIFLMNLEFRYPIYKKFGGTIFWDMGNVWCCYKYVRLQSLRHGLGCGLRYASPIGIVRLDVGLKVNRRTNEGAGEIHFTLGQIF